jgi:hypothetical protein
MLCIKTIAVYSQKERKLANEFYRLNVRLCNVKQAVQMVTTVL